MSDRLKQLIEELAGARTLLDGADRVAFGDLNKHLDKIYTSVERAEKIAVAMRDGVPV